MACCVSAEGNHYTGIYNLIGYSTRAAFATTSHRVLSPMSTNAVHLRHSDCGALACGASDLKALPARAFTTLNPNFLVHAPAGDFLQVKLPGAWGRAHVTSSKNTALRKGGYKSLMGKGS